MSVRSYLRLVSRYWLGALLIGVLAGVLGGLVVQFMNKPEYTASATIAMHVEEDGASQGTVRPNIDQLAASAPALLTSPRVLIPAGNSVNPAMSADQLQKVLNVKTPSQSLVFTASLSGPEERVTTVMNKIAQEFQDAVAAGELPSYAGVKLTVNWPMVEAALFSVDVRTEKSAASTIGQLSGIMVGAGVGLLVAFLYLFLRVFLDDRVRNAEDLQELTDDAVLTAASPADVVQVLSQGLPYLSAGPGENVIAVSGIASGATSLVKDLAAATAKSGASVALVDLDLAAHPLGDSHPGLADVVSQRAALADVVTSADGVDVITAGGPVPNASEFLTRSGFAEALRELGSGHDWVLVNTGALTASSAGVLGAKLADTALVVVQQGTSSRRDVAQVLNLVEATGVKVAGLVLP